MAEMTHEQKIKVLVDVIHNMDPDNPEQFTKDGLPDCNSLTELAEFRVDKMMRDEAWNRFNKGEDAVAPEDIDADPDETVKADEVEYSRSDFEFHGNWMEGNKVISRMWVQSSTGKKFYEKNAHTIDRGLPIYPFSGR